MAISHISYLEIHPKTRSIAAEKARQQVRNMISNNFLSPDQITYLQYRLQVIDQWEHGLVKGRDISKFLPPKSE